MKLRNSNRRLSRRLSIYLNIFLAMLMASCGSWGAQSNPTNTPSPSKNTQASGSEIPTVQPISMAVTTFVVEAPVMPASQDISLDILDEVTGLALNPIRYRMTPQDNRHFTVELPLPVGSVIKYRYSRVQNIPINETSSQGKPVRYRLYSVRGPGAVQDIVSGWIDLPYSGATGRISGTVVDSVQKAPLANILVEAGGVQTLTTSDGSFYLEGLAPGQHHLTVYAMDGAYQTAQQGAVVAAESTTPAEFSMTPQPLIKITFNLAVPQEAINVPVRIAGNILQLGNSFADLDGGVNGIATRMPVMAPDAQGKLSITLSLPAGTALEYKYTLGDGFWNAEHTPDGQFRIRQWIVPDKDTVVNDSVDTWKSGKTATITFDVHAPTNTPATDDVSIQFNPYSWTEPIPMWSLGDNHWMYILFSPIDRLSALSYRYCRNEQCGSADDLATQGADAKGWPVTPGAVPQTFNDQVKAWAWWQPDSKPTTVAAVDLKPRDKSFMAGVEFQAAYDPSWQPRYLHDLQDLHNSGSNWMVLSPTWTFTHSTSPVLEQVPGKDPLWSDLVETLGQAKAIGLKTALYPQPVFPSSTSDWWNAAPRNFSWWQAWFERYQKFVVSHADLAAKTGADALVLGGDWLSPALPQGKLSDGAASGVPGDVESRWRDLIGQVRAHYKGTLIWAISYPDGMRTPPPFIDLVDQVYILYQAPVSAKNNPSEQDLQADLAAELDRDIFTFYNQNKKPVILGIDYPSVNGSAGACIPGPDGKCLDQKAFDQPGQDIPSTTLYLQGQVDIYNAFMVEVNSRGWIDGFISRGFYPPAPLQDKSPSLHGKPAFDVLAYWFGKLGLNR